MISIIILLSIGVIVGFVAYGVLSESGEGGEKKEKVGSSGESEKAGENKNKLQVDEKTGNKQKILDLLENDLNPSDGQERKITNDQVEKMLGVSDTTVGRYLDELESEGKIKQVGNTGKSVYYTKKN
ncbi:hypothetical protein L6261_01880 [Candidatus Parcubacteria bacterium]|nr:hypothetical protein [Candidatus Parcubacteria bacterium]